MSLFSAQAADLYKGAKEVMICEVSMKALKNPGWYAAKEKPLFNGKVYYDLAVNRYLFYFDTYSIAGMSKPDKKQNVKT